VPQPLTEADGDRFETVVLIVAEGVRLFRQLAPEMANDLLVQCRCSRCSRGTSGGVVSASSRYVPGIVLIDEPTSPMEVAEALVHEGAHEKFFDLAIAREFLDAGAEGAEFFESSWSHAQWPLEQTFAAWHAYTCLGQFFLLVGAEQLGPHSLLPKARERAAEIGDWLLVHEDALRADARWLLHGLTGVHTGAHTGEADSRSQVDCVTLSDKICEEGRFRVLPDVSCRHAQSGHTVAGRRTQPPEIYWLGEDAIWALAQLLHDRRSLSFKFMLTIVSEEWQWTPRLRSIA
jgi:hypothetical protein